MTKLSMKETIKVLEEFDELCKKDKSFVTTGDYVEYIGDKYPELRKNVGYPVSSAWHSDNGKKEYTFTTKDEAPGLYDSDQFEKIVDKEEFLKRIKISDKDKKAAGECDPTKWDYLPNYPIEEK